MLLFKLINQGVVSREANGRALRNRAQRDWARVWKAVAIARVARAFAPKPPEQGVNGAGAG